MGINSTEVAYNFGQLGSAYSDVAQTIVPPKDHVIVAIQFLADNTPTVLTPEKLDRNGPGYIAISGSTGDDVEVANNNYFNFNGVHASEVTDGTIAAGGDVTLATSGAGRVRVGQYVLLVNDDADENGNPAMTIDAETPTPIYTGPSARGVKVTGFNGTTTVNLDTQITPSSQALIFLDEYHGAGGITVQGQVFPKGLTIYGRWTAFTPSTGGVVCYFGK
tara:strand:- start:828 stop:1487 length:660 start_codon:yes stop_codon:yes gene_type:complete